MFPLHKSPISKVIIHPGEKEKTSGAAGKENLSECICSVSAFKLPAESSTCYNSARFNMQGVGLKLTGYTLMNNYY